ncbi:inorganic polyphosphate/ATP-NAD kinase [mine drainage metagenome]|uniref:Inorganic polyphosphate/ATP-NAD kinase n=1 Tax=mine drainage metagenome TaxID=410659 RepID=T0XZU3_9ZZZZ
MKIKFVLDRYCGVEMRDALRIIKRENIDIQVSNKDYNAVVIVGGDGSFLDHAEDYDKPVLPIEGIHKGQLKSVGVLTEHKFSEMGTVLRALSEGRFRVEKEPVLELTHSGRTYKSIGDFYIERRDTKESIRYKAVITDGAKRVISYAISNGFIITTPTGSTGYFSYMDILQHRKPKRINGLGFAHILPSSVKDLVGGKEVPYKIRRVFSQKARAEIYLERNSAYLFGIPKRNGGIKITDGHVSVKIIPGGLEKIIV